jgi:acetyltransferase
MHQIDRLTAPISAKVRLDLIDLLTDAVDGGASVGFLPPLSEGEAGAFWDKACADLGHRTILAARDAGGRIVGSVQLVPALMPSQQHRAEIAKLLVHSQARRKGIGRALMLAIEAEARVQGRMLLILDCRRGDAANDLYHSLGYNHVGIIPRYARNGDGNLDDTVYYYKELA